MIRDIITDEKILSQKCLPWDLSDPSMEKHIGDLLKIAFHLRDSCAGLAFNQIGIIKRGFVIKIKETENSFSFKVFINPEYVMRSPNVKARFETCLSRPGKDPIKKRRSVKIKIKYHDPVSETLKIEIFRAFEARVVQHEMNHLNGILI